MLGWKLLQKRMFIIQKNIHNAFAKTGIWPQNLDIMLNTIRKPEQPSIPTKFLSQYIQTPKTVHAIHRTHLAYRCGHQEPMLVKIIVGLTQGLRSGCDRQPESDQNSVDNCKTMLKTKERSGRYWA